MHGHAALQMVTAEWQSAPIRWEAVGYSKPAVGSQQPSVPICNYAPAGGVRGAGRGVATGS